MLYLDFETFNTQPIKVGAYRYAKTAEVLLCAYAFDDGPVQVWDQTRDPAMPDQFRAALTDPTTAVTAHNANFDRVILRDALGIDVPIPRWRCTRAKALSHALPGSLDACGKALGVSVDQAKLADGGKLIHRFCKPAAKNHKADRYDRATHPEEWERFKDYAARDVEAMREIDKLLPDWNWRSRDIALYHLDQTINDRGFQVDRDLVTAGADAAAAEQARLAAEFAELTGGAVARPAQREAFRQYLNTAFGLTLENTQAETLRRVLAEEKDLDPIGRRLIEIAMLFNKSSTAKYAALAPAVSDDGRFRGGLQFRGASRTRRWCLTGDHEVLTENGWVRLDTWPGGVIAQWRNGTVTFAHANRVAFDYAGDLITVQRKHRIDAVMTPEHVLCTDGTGARKTAGGAFGHHVTGIARHGVLRREPVSTIRTRVLVMLQHDGYAERNTVAWSFKKKRKSTRCQKLLGAAGIAFTVTRKADGVYRIYVPTKDRPDWLFKKDFGPWLLQERHCPRAFIDEIAHWDGGNRRRKQVEVCSRAHVNADWTATMAHLAGFSATVTRRANGYWFVNVSKSGNSVSIKPKDWGTRPFRGTVYCAATRTGYFLTRRHGTVHVTGNSGKGFQAQNLPSRGLPPQQAIDQYVRALKAGCHDFLFEDLMRYGAAALRGVLVAPAGARLAVADLANIEGRILAWLAGETWKLKAFRDYDAGRGPDLYSLTAASILGGRPEDISRQDRDVFGKVPDLACGYEGGFGAFQTFTKAYGVRLTDHWDTIRANVDPACIVEAKQNYTHWGADKALDADKADWIAADAVKLAWRARHPKSVALWHACKTAARLAIRNPGRVFRAGRRLRFAVKPYAGRPYLLCRLPSGSYLTYFAPRYHTADDAITYMGVDRAGGVAGAWCRQTTYGGKLVENVCQSLALDVLAANMPAAESAGFRIVLTVHDEVVAEAPAGKTVMDLTRIMAAPPAWADGLPLNATGFDCERYRKG